MWLNEIRNKMVYLRISKLHRTKSAKDEPSIGIFRNRLSLDSFTLIGGKPYPKGWGSSLPFSEIQVSKEFGAI